MEYGRYDEDVVLEAREAGWRMEDLRIYLSCTGIEQLMMMMSSHIPMHDVCMICIISTKMSAVSGQRRSMARLGVAKST